MLDDCTQVGVGVKVGVLVGVNVGTFVGVAVGTLVGCCGVGVQLVQTFPVQAHNWSQFPPVFNTPMVATPLLQKQRAMGGVIEAGQFALH